MAARSNNVLTNDLILIRMGWYLLFNYLRS